MANDSALMAEPVPLENCFGPGADLEFNENLVLKFVDHSAADLHDVGHFLVEQSLGEVPHDLVLTLRQGKPHCSCAGEASEMSASGRFFELARAASLRPIQNAWARGPVFHCDRNRLCFSRKHPL